MKLSSKQRHGLSDATFALPGRHYPIPDASHARNALARASQNASPAQQATIKRKVKAKFPAITVGGKPKPKGYADGGFVDRVKGAIGFGPKETLMQKTLREQAERDAAPRAPAPTAPAAVEDKSKRRKQLDEQIEKAGG